MNERAFLEAHVLATHQRAEQHPVAHNKRHVPERILLERGFFGRKAEHEPCRFIGFEFHLEIFLEGHLCCGNRSGTRSVIFSRKGIDLFGILARERPQKDVLLLRKIIREHRRERILEAPAVKHQLMPVQFIAEPEFGEGLRKTF